MPLRSSVIALQEHRDVPAEGLVAVDAGIEYPQPVLAELGRSRIHLFVDVLEAGREVQVFVAAADDGIAEIRIARIRDRIELERRQRSFRMRVAVGERQIAEKAFGADAHLLEQLEDVLLLEVEGLVIDDGSAVAEFREIVEVDAQQAAERPDRDGAVILDVDQRAVGLVADDRDIEFDGAALMPHRPQRGRDLDARHIGGEEKITLRFADIERPHAAQLLDIVFDLGLRVAVVAEHPHAGDIGFDDLEDDMALGDLLLRDFHPREEALPEKDLRGTIADIAERCDRHVAADHALIGGGEFLRGDRRGAVEGNAGELEGKRRGAQRARTGLRRRQDIAA